MWFDAFPLLAAWEATNDVPSFEEYLTDVQHHLETAERAYNRCRNRIEESEILARENGPLIILTIGAAGLGQAWDQAVRAAISAVELGLQLTNHVLALGIKKKNVKWPSVKTALERLGSDGEPLLRHLESHFKSIGWALFYDYRNWATHRGAPLVLCSLPTLAEIPSPSLEGPSLPAGEVVNTFLLDNMEVLCRPFVPPVHGILDDEKGTPVAPGVGITLPPGSNIRLKGNTVTVGHLGEDAASYRSKNPVELGAGFVQRSGEQLQRYTAREYLSAIVQVLSFVGETLRGPWDRALRDLCARKRPPQGPT